MHKIKVILFLFFTFTWLSASESDTLWTRNFGGDSTESPYGICSTPTGDYLIAASTKSYPDSVYNAWILKVSNSGDLLWARVFGGNGIDYAKGCAVDRDGYYIVEGHTNNYGPLFKPNLWLLKIDPQSGDTLWTKGYDKGYIEYGYGCAVDSSGNYVLLGDIFKSAGDDDIWVLVVDTAGDTLWSYVYASLGGFGERAYSLEVDSEGYYIVAGYTTDDSSGTKDIFIFKIDPATHDTVWTLTWGTDGDDVAYDCAVDRNGDYVITGYTSPYSNGYYDILVMKIDHLTGSIVWYNHYGTEYLPEQAFGCAVDKNNRYIVSGTASPYAGAYYDYILLDIDPVSSDTLWTHTYGGDGYDGKAMVAIDRDGYYVLAGESNSFSNGALDVWVVRLAGSNLIEEHKQKNKLNTKTLVLSEGTLRLPFAKKGESIAVYSTNGECIYKGPYSVGSIFMPTGVYLAKYKKGFLRLLMIR